MNKVIGYIITILVTFFIFFIYHKNEVSDMERTIERLQNENSSLNKKIGMIEKNFEDFVKKREKNKVKYVYEPKNKKNKLVVEKHLEQVNKDIDEFEKNMDSIKTILPNRTGDELINSLKLKTSL
jgi:predicted RNase H-like nuclease (RuvC/YqgF family)